MDQTRKTRGEKARDRREAILEAAFQEFTSRGFADTRIEDVARRADVAKGTIYLHFSDKEALFEGVVRHVMVPIAQIDQPLPELPPGMSVREAVAAQMVASAVDFPNSRLADIIRLLVSEGLRFPHLIKFYRSEILEPSLQRIRVLLEEAWRRGELRSREIIDFPMVIGAPMLLGAIWHGVMADRETLNVAAMMEAFINALFRDPQEGQTSSAT